MSRRVLTRAQALAQRFILGYETTHAQIESAMLAIERAYAVRDGLRSTMDSFSHSPQNRDRLADAIAMTDESIECIRERIPEIGSRYESIDEVLGKVSAEDWEAGQALRLYYLNGKTYEEIAESIHCSPATVYRAMDRGLDRVFWIIADGLESNG